MSSTLKFTTMTIPQANLGTPSVIPDIHNGYRSTGIPSVKLSEGMLEDEGAWVNQGRVHTMLPYTMQDGYDRNLTERPMRTAVLENEYLRAEFSLELGGRLWSLYSKTEGRELYMNNGVFQPANLALRNAWFSGGIEWNIGIIGHHPYTCSPLFAARYKNEKGGDVLKMYEYERKRGLTYCVRATLAEDVLLVRVNIENLSGRDTYVYWWSNGAVEETPKTRVIVPAQTYYSYPYEDGAARVTAPEVPKDAYYPANHDHAYDYFYRIPAGRRRFMSYYDGEGKGMAQFSTDNELGRKLFVWGTQKPGGKNWNRWLQRDGRYYAELQSGLLHSQHEQRPMKAGELIEWTEGYIASSGDKSVIHGEDYDKANRYVENMLVSDGRFELVDNSDSYFTPVGEEEIMVYGSGWGALEELSRKKAGIADWRLSRLAVFPMASVSGKPEEEFRELLENGSLRTHSTEMTDSDIVEFCMGGRFIDALCNAERKDWYTWLQLGCAYYEACSYDAARAAFRKSVQLKENFIALRCLAWMTAADYETARSRGADCGGLLDSAKGYIERAAELGSGYSRMLWDAMSFTRAYFGPEETVKLVEKSGGMYKNTPFEGRISLFYAQSLAKVGRLDEALEALLSAPEIPDIREGEVSTSAIWLEIYRGIIARSENRKPEDITDSEIYEKYPLPQELDFRMS